MILQKFGEWMRLTGVVIFTLSVIGYGTGFGFSMWAIGLGTSLCVVGSLIYLTNRDTADEENNPVDVDEPEEDEETEEWRLVLVYKNGEDEEYTYFTKQKVEAAKQSILTALDNGTKTVVVEDEEDEETSTIIVSDIRKVRTYQYD